MKETQIKYEHKNFFGLATDLVSIATEDGCFVKVNTQWEKALGYSISELLNSKFLDFIHPEDDKLKSSVLGDVVKILDGDSVYTGCGLGLKQCDASAPCPLHDKFISIRDNLQEMLESTTLDSLIKGASTDFLWLKR